jgi:hypothetical protein
MSRQNPVLTDVDFLLHGSPASPRHENFSRLEVSADLAALTTQVMLSVAVPLQAGAQVSSITFVSGATAANTPTNYWAALYDPSGNLLSQSPDLLTATWAADTAKTFTLAQAQASGPAAVYYAALMVKATAVPSLMGRSVNRAVAAGAILAGMPVLAQTSGSALTGTAPATIATPTTVANVPYVVLS